MATYTYDTSTDIGQVRLYIGDTDIDPTTDAYFSDEEIQVFLDAEGSVLSAAALALEAMASSTARLAKLLKTINFTKDTRQAANDLRAQAQSLREKEGDDFGFAEQAVTGFNVRRILANKTLRGGT